MSEEHSYSTNRKRTRPIYYHEEIQDPKKKLKMGKGNSLGNAKDVTVYQETMPIPTKNSSGNILFLDYPDFRPNLTPKEVLQAGSFGGTYFRVITSGITGETYKDAWKEFPTDWFDGLNISRQISSKAYDTEVNTYKVSCGGDLKMWEESGWITEVDPYGWFQWYCRFYLGRRCSDDERQIARAMGVMGPKGRWRKNLINKCLNSSKPLEKSLNDSSIAPKVRQLLQVLQSRLFFAFYYLILHVALGLSLNIERLARWCKMKSN